MRIAYLCHRVPYPPEKGDKIRAWHQIQTIASRHELDLFTLADDPADLRHTETLKRVCRNATIVAINPRVAKLKALRGLFTGEPLTLPFFHAPALESAVRSAAVSSRYDRVIVYCSAMAQYVKDLRGIPVISDLVDVDSDKWAQYRQHVPFPMSAVYAREARRLRLFERRICVDSSAVVVTTEREAELLAGFAETSNIHIIPNGVDGEYFHPAPQSASEPAIIFTGDMSYFPNEEAVVLFARNILPLIRLSVPGTRFFVVGQKPGPRVTALREIEGVEVTGFVPDVRTFIWRAQVSVAPFTIAAGIQNKILEAMASGVPVVATRRAAQGLSASVAKAVTIAEDAPEIAQAVSRLLLNPSEAKRQGTEGRHRVLAAYNWRRSGSELLRLIEQPEIRYSCPEQGATSPDPDVAQQRIRS